MNYKKHFKKRALTLAVTSAVGLQASIALAQTDNNEEPSAQALEEIYVTGTRLRNLNLDGYAPVEVLSREDLLVSGSVDIGDVLGKLPGFSGSPIGTTTNNGGNGSVQVDLRGLGEIRTLVLIDGVRVVEGNDFQTIPTAMIDRIEVLKEGAAAVYGADAVSGVVNVITRKEIDGPEVKVQYSQSFDAGEDNVATISFATGKTFERGNVTFVAEYSEQEGAFQGDYSYDFFQDSRFIFDANGTADTFFNRGVVTTAQDPTNFSAILLGSSRIPGGRFITNEDTTVNGVSFAAGSNLTRDLNTGEIRPYAGGLFDVPNDTYNYAPVNYMQTPYEKANLFASFDYELTDTTNFNAKVRYSDRTSEQVLAPVPFSSTTDPSYASIVPGVAISGDNFYNTLGVDIGSAFRRMIERDRSFTQDVEQVQVILGLDGRFSNDIGWKTSASYGKRERTDFDFGQLFGPNLSLALGPSFQDASGNIVCGTPGNVIDGCVPVNFFGGPGGVTDEQYDYIGITLRDETEAETIILNGSVDGDFEVAGLGAAWALGFEYRDEEGFFIPDVLKQQDLVTGNTGQSTIGGFDVTSVFGEVGSVLFDNGNQSLEVNLGGRYDDFNLFGGDSTFQGKLKFQIMEGLVLRANYAEVFRAPGIGELFAGLSDGFPTANDPCGDRFAGGYTPIGCPAGSPITQADTQLLGRFGGNVNLEAEQGDNQIIGLVWQPSFVDGLNITLDYWQIELEDAINNVSVQGVLDFCHRDGLLCDSITRRADGTIGSVLSAAQNIATETAAGYDFTIDYKWSIDSIGADMRFDLQYTLLDERNFQPDPTSPVQELAGTFDSTFGDNFVEDKAVATLAAAFEKFTLTAEVEYVGGVTYVTAFTGDEVDVDSQLYLDFAGTYQINDVWEVRAGITNVADEEPPFLDAGFNGSTDPSSYRIEGRGGFFSVGADF